MSRKLKNSFDQSIKDAIGNHQVPYDDASWDLLEQKMTQLDPAGEKSVDELAKEAVGKLEVPYHPGTWEILSERLDRINYRKRLIASKVFEAAVIFFAIFTLVKFLGQIPEVRELLPQSLAQENAEATRDDLATSSEASNLTEAAIVSDRNLSSEETRTKELKVTESAGPQISSDPLEKLPLRSQSLINSNSSRSIATHRDVHIADLIESRDLALESMVPVLTEKKKHEYVTMLPVYDMAMLQAETAHDFHVVTSVPQSKVVTKIGVFHQQNWHVLNRLVYILGGGVINQQKPLQTGGNGFVTNVQFGRLGFDLGGNYTRLKYVAGDGTSVIEKLQVPLNIRYITKETRYADFYALVGGSLHAVMRAKYAPPSLAAAAPDGDSRSKQKYNDGLLEGGYREGNTYYSANAGFGVDIPITKNIGLFSEVIYQQHWQKRIGYTEDKISTFSLNLGVTTKL